MPVQVMSVNSAQLGGQKLQDGGSRHNASAFAQFHFRVGSYTQPFTKMLAIDIVYESATCRVFGDAKVDDIDRCCTGGARQPEVHKELRKRTPVGIF